MLIAFAAALLGTLLFMGIMRNLKQKNIIFVPLIGIMLGGVIDAITTVIAYRYELVQNISTWMMGNFSMIIKGRYELLYLSIPLLIVAYLYAQHFTIAGMGEDFATNLALNYNRIVNTGVTIVALITALVIITVGRIPFLGLVVPNIVGFFTKVIICATPLSQQLCSVRFFFWSATFSAASSSSLMKFPSV